MAYQAFSSRQSSGSIRVSGGAAGGQFAGGHSGFGAAQSCDFSGGQGSGFGGGFGGGQAGGFGGGQAGGFGGGHGGGFGGGFGGGQGGGFGGGHAGGFGGGHGGGFGGGHGGGFGGGFGGGQGGDFDGAGGFVGGQGGGFGGGGFGGSESLLSGNKKETMQNLNDRLATYMEKVHSLENSNANLEQKIKDWYGQDRPGGTTDGSGHDYSHFYQSVEDLSNEIFQITIEVGKTILEIDNARLAADDFRQKYDYERVLLQTVEADTNGLRKVMDELNLTKSEMETEVEHLNEELISLKKNHEEEKQGLQGTGAGQLNVEMNAAPGVDLTEILNKMRGEYEQLAEKNRQDAEQCFNEACKPLKKEISAGAEEMQSGKTEITDLKRTLQGLEVEMQSLLAQKKSLEGTLAETEGRYCMEISKLQTTISMIEGQLSEIRADLEEQSAQHAELLDTKSRLEMEIETYRRLLDGEGQGGQGGHGEHGGHGGHGGHGQQQSVHTPPSLTKETKKIIKTTKIIEELEDGKVIASKTEQTEKEM
ncbi:keratin, type I cytoskeletal 47 kDa-like isoform X3 [Rhinatrema bivittatum]|uniref:keratin, type I cytoskeletal 47 kDa-like isoform X3 n=1 Tax=Rhinatrema bivittatum TaxID=194408 RepID=UPI001129630B|nr:keratin, type I cytoskeletal 47 kDa-like isoform X3 [Rhinatrema bivittatum]